MPLISLQRVRLFQGRFGKWPRRLAFLFVLFLLMAGQWIFIRYCARRTSSLEIQDFLEGARGFIISFLPGCGTVGFVSDKSFQSDLIYFLTYVLAPRIVVPGDRPEFIVGVFFEQEDLSPFLERNGYDLVGWRFGSDNEGVLTVLRKKAL